MKELVENVMKEVDVKEFISKIEDKLDGDQIVKLVSIIMICSLVNKK